MFTYHVRQDLPADTRLVLTITDAAGRQIRRLDLDKSAGLRRVAWNLHVGLRRRRRRGAPTPPRPRRSGRGGGGGGRGGRGGGGGPAVALGRYVATLGKITGETVTPIGPSQSFMVVPLEDKTLIMGQ